MTHTYSLTGMSCSGCKARVENALNALPEIMHVTADVQKAEVTIEMRTHVSLGKLQEALAAAGLHHYTIDLPGVADISPAHPHAAALPAKPGNGIYYCPMHCEGEKTYDKPGDCPVCGMDLVEQPCLPASQEYTCPMHPEIITSEPGACPVCGMDLIPLQPSAGAEQKTYRELVKKMKIAVAFALPVFIISMSDMLHANPLLKLLNTQQWNWVQFVLTLPVAFYSGWIFFVRAWKSFTSRNLNMFSLIGIGTGVAFIFSITGLLLPGIFPAAFKTSEGTVHVYFEAVAVILTLVLLGQLLEAHAHNQTSDAIKALLKMTPSEAILLENGTEKVVSVHSIKTGDLLRVKPGNKIPVDGIIKEGSSTIDESMITGEPIPADKKEGDKISAGTINGTKSFTMVAQKVGADTLLAQIIQLVHTASRSRAPIQKLADVISKYFVPAVMLVSVSTFVIWALWGPEPAYVYGLANAIAVLIIACPCALGLATPMSVMVGIGKGAQAGILIKHAEALEILNKIDVLVIDKTGTLTEGKPSVDTLFALEGNSESGLLQKIASLNQYSEHPLATAVMDYAKAKNASLAEVKDFDAQTGKGVTGTVAGKKIALGNITLMKDMQIPVSEILQVRITEEQRSGKTVSFIAVDGEAAGYIAISDAIKKTSKQAIAALQQTGIAVIMLTGDNKLTAKAVSDALQLTDFRAECLPEDKLNVIKELQAKGKIVAMAGDGINDSPALALAQVGIAMGTGTDVAIESAGITLVKGDLHGIVKAKNLSHAVMKNIRQNLFFAFIYNTLGIPLAAGILFPAFGILLSPMLAATAMSLSSVSVIVNALRLKRISLDS